MDINSLLDAAIADVENFKDEEKVNIKGKLYTQVKDRNRIFRKHFRTKLEVITDYEFTDQNTVVCKTTCKDKEKILAVGIAESVRNSSQDKVMEKTQTVSLGRMLACLGLDGGEFASGDEIAAFVHPMNPPQTKSTANVEKRYNEDEVFLKKTENNVNNVQEASKNDSNNITNYSYDHINTIRNKLTQAKHLGQLKEIFSEHKNEIENNPQLQNFFNNRRNGINNDF